MKLNTLLVTTFCGFIFVGCGGGSSSSENFGINQIALGEKLYHDTSLSKDKTMSCATCHVIDSAFVDPRPTNLSLGASLGDDLVSIGDRNAPTAAYAKFIPKFHFDSREGLFIGGQFLDGRATDLTEQAKGPFLNPVEMNMPDEASVIARVQENSEYVQAFKEIYGDDIFADTQKAYAALADTIAKFEKSDTFAPFSSKYDKALKGEEILTEQEVRGLALFNGKAECHACHPADGSKANFTDFSYDNLGVPVNHALRSANGKGADFIDNGLYENTQVNDKGLKGAFRVSTLRNIAVTGPYMHNGLFKDLATVVHFYNTRDVVGAINPETGAAWEKGEVEINKNSAELGNLKLTDEEEADLVAFLITLTDEEYEHLIP
ncbi:MAG: methylamine utilization protein MauG [Epsilonproteobacteria bacterium]|nr:MAG: methylamine utilization protein MauG [Campylobacterota bacterium]